MQEVTTNLPVGSSIHQRYVIERLLGRGGFGAVYLVRDQRVNGNLFALKEVVHTDKAERRRFLCEAELLRRLEHPVLPRVYHVFEDEARGRAYMLMDYIEGPTLEQLRLQQPGKRFSPRALLTIMKPVMEVVIYLHHQQPPILHRDIKPANIIVPSSGASAVLVDFGIAKEYGIDATTTALRHCSPGYAAPEQYAQGTCIATDVYGLAATCYTLLTGSVPVDALARITRLSSRDTDPLLPVNQLEPAVSSAVALVIQRALSLAIEERFASVADFWLALCASCDEREATMRDLPVIATTPQLSSAPISISNAPVTVSIYPVDQYYPSYNQGKRTFWPLLVAVAMWLIVSFGVGYYVYTLYSLPPAQKNVAALTKSPSLTGSSASLQTRSTPAISTATTTPLVTLTAVATTAPSPTATPSSVDLEGQPTATPETGTDESLPTATAVSTWQPSPTPLPVASPVATQVPDPAPTRAVLPVSPPTSSYPTLSMAYHGTVDDTQDQPDIKASMRLTSISQHGATISGYFVVDYPLIGSNPFTGAVTTTGTIAFTVESLNGNGPLYFSGRIHADGHLSGTYCSLDRAGHCNPGAGKSGAWSVVPS